MKTRRQKRSCTTSPRPGQNDTTARKASHPILTKTVMDDLTALERRKEKAKLQRLRRKKRFKKKNNEKPQTSNFSPITIDTSTSGSENNTINSDLESTNSEIDVHLSFGASNKHVETRLTGKLPQNETRQEISYLNKWQSTASDVAKVPLHSGEHTAESYETYSKNHGPSSVPQTKISLSSSGIDKSKPFSQPNKPMQIGCSRTLEWSESKMVNLHQKNLPISIIVENELIQKNKTDFESQVNGNHPNKSFAFTNDINRKSNDNLSKNSHISKTLPTEGGINDSDHISHKKISQETNVSVLNTGKYENETNLLSKDENPPLNPLTTRKGKNIQQIDNNNSSNIVRNISSGIRSELNTTNTAGLSKELHKNGQEKSREKNKNLAKTTRAKRVINSNQSSTRPLPVHRVKCPICGDMFDPFDIEYHASHCGNPESPSNKINEEQNRPKQSENSTSTKNTLRAKDIKAVVYQHPPKANEINPKPTKSIERAQKSENHPVINNPVYTPPNTNVGMKPPVFTNNSVPKPVHTPPNTNVGMKPPMLTNNSMPKPVYTPPNTNAGMKPPVFTNNSVPKPVYTPPNTNVGMQPPVLTNNSVPKPVHTPPNTNVGMQPPVRTNNSVPQPIYAPPNTNAGMKPPVLTNNSVPKPVHTPPNTNVGMNPPLRTNNSMPQPLYAPPNTNVGMNPLVLTNNSMPKPIYAPPNTNVGMNPPLRTNNSMPQPIYAPPNTNAGMQPPVLTNNSMPQPIYAPPNTNVGMTPPVRTNNSMPQPLYAAPNNNAGMQPPVRTNNSMPSVNILNSQSTLQSNNVYTYNNGQIKSTPSKASANIEFNDTSTKTTTSTKVPPLRMELSEISKLDHNKRIPVKSKLKNDEEQSIDKLLKPESSTFNMLSTSLTECDRLSQHSRIALKRNEADIRLSEEKKLAKRERSSNKSSSDLTDRKGQSFLEAVGIVMKQDMLVQSMFPSYIEMDQSEKKRKKWHHLHHSPSNSLVPLSDKSHASVNDAGLFLRKLKMVSSEVYSKRQRSIQSELSNNGKSFNGNEAIMEALRLIRNARDGNTSILSLMKDMKLLILNLTNQLENAPHKCAIEKDLISLFESFLPAFYSLENVLSSTEVNNYSPSLCVRTHTSILWEPKEVSNSQFAHLNTINPSPLNPCIDSPSPTSRSEQEDSSGILNGDDVRNEKPNIGHSDVPLITKLSTLNSTEPFIPPPPRETDKVITEKPHEASKSETKTGNGPQLVPKRQSESSHTLYSREGKPSLSQKKRPKIAKATNTFTHFCREVKPEIEKEIRQNENIPLSDIKEAVRERAKLMWKALPDSEREIYRKKSQADFERYELEMKELRNHSEEI